MTKKIAIHLCSILIYFLLAMTGYSAEVTFFYHTDPAGTPLAMTNASGTVVWRGDYKPFGEELEITPEPENKLKFVGKEKDKETGLLYFGARYMEPKIGRFISTDSIGPVDPKTGKVNTKNLLNSQRLNYYVYGLNNPYRYIDPDGKWPAIIKEVHQASINRVLTNLSVRDRNVLNQQQRIMDTSEKYTHPNMHGLAAPGQTPLQAWEGANNFVRVSLETARELEKRGYHDEALIHVGNAIHTMHDTTSPTHEGYQRNPDGLGYPRHIAGETFEGNRGAAIDSMTQRAWNIFKSNDPVRKEVLPRP